MFEIVLEIAGHELQIHAFCNKQNKSLPLNSEESKCL